MKVETFFWFVMGTTALVLGLMLIDDALQQQTFRSACIYEGVAPTECLRIFP